MLNRAKSTAFWDQTARVNQPRSAYCWAFYAPTAGPSTYWVAIRGKTPSPYIDDWRMYPETLNYGPIVPAARQSTCLHGYAAGWTNNTAMSYASASISILPKTLAPIPRAIDKKLR